MATGRSKFFNVERDCEPWQHVDPTKQQLERHKQLLLRGVPHAESWAASMTKGLFEAAFLASRPPILDAKPMSREAILFRREEGWLLHYIWGNGNPHYVPSPTDPLVSGVHDRFDVAQQLNARRQEVEELRWRGNFLASLYEHAQLTAQRLDREILAELDEAQ